MNSISKLKAALAVTILLALPLAQAGTMNLADYYSAKTRIGADHEIDKEACGKLAANARDVCIEEAKATDKVARAELEFAYSGKASDQNARLVARAESAYAVAKEKCDDKAGNDKDVCVAEAKAAETKALAAAKMDKQVGEAKTEAAQDSREADYKVAAEKCEAMAGDAKTSCVSAAKARFGKS
ncbi:hypothetical protein [Rivibacter subsaxonicus]|uniref:Uncharacterized protein n=1 Tax=Rivibacter subsaxonicus TaxID=457575 RepID=A0A4Q7W293_9BURK|nr:hypothetical protein [Rivibacter subsaxonicus]RZU03138.1 hypothetical protein EV670_1171 [Rivibacter subsaxonicus]